MDLPISTEAGEKVQAETAEEDAALARKLPNCVIKTAPVRGTKATTENKITHKKAYELVAYPFNLSKLIIFPLTNENICFLAQSVNE